MANRKKHDPIPQPFKPTMSVIPSTYCNQFEYVVEGNVVGIRFGRNNETHVDVTIPLELFLLLGEKARAQVPVPGSVQSN